jgi:hypothetical protein
MRRRDLTGCQDGELLSWAFVRFPRPPTTLLATLLLGHASLGCGRTVLPPLEQLSASDDTPGDADADADAGDDGDGWHVGEALLANPQFPHDCGAFLPATGTVVDVTVAQAADLPAIIAAAAPDTTIRLGPGTYSYSQSIYISAPGLVLRSASGNPDDVVLDAAPTIITAVHIIAPRVTVAELTITGSADDLLHADAYVGDNFSQLLVYRVHFLDAWDTAFVLGGNLGGVVDSSVIACSTIELTDGFRPTGWTQPLGARIFGTRGTLSYRNLFRGIYHPGEAGSSGIVLAAGTRGARIERNVFENSAMPLRVGTGVSDPGGAIAYTDNPCADLAAYSDAYEIAVCSNTVFADIAEFQTGISLEAACNTAIAHNTVYGVPSDASIHASGAGGRVRVLDNATSNALLLDGGVIVEESLGNVENLPSGTFVDAPNRDLHLNASSAATGQGVPLAHGLCDFDLDGGAFKAIAPDAGADQAGSP